MQPEHKDLWAEIKANKKELYSEVDDLKRMSYQQETQIEVLKEKVAEEKYLKEKSQLFIRWGGGIAFTIIMGLTSWVNSTSELVTRYDERIHAMEVQIEKNRNGVNDVSDNVIKVQDWADEKFQPKQ